jgi:glycine/D-amino acid oxidase-like deaminating enzyme
VFVDALIVGGGIQGLVVLRSLSAAGHRAVLVTDTELGRGQTLHSHGLLDGGTGLVTGETRAEVVDHILPELRRLRVAIRSEAPSYLALPPTMVEQLEASWAKLPDPPQPVSIDESLGLRLSSPIHRVTAHHVSKTALIGALVDGLRDRVVRGRLVDVDGTCRIDPAGGGARLAVEVGVVVVAAGCGTPRLLAGTLGRGASLLPRLGHVRTHMLCLRASAGVLPLVGSVVTPDLVIVAHQRGDGAALWYVTPQVGEPVRVPVVPDDAEADVESDVVAAAVARLRDRVPALAERDPDVEATVFAGYKQDVDGQVTRRLVEFLPGDPPIVVAVPCVFAGAWANAREVVDLVAGLAPARGVDGPLLVGRGPVPVGRDGEARPGVRWAPWREWADSFVR